VNCLEYLNKEPGEKSNLFEKNSVGTSAHMLVRRCFNIFLSVGYINTHPTVIVFCFLRVVELEENLSQNP
jgi:hypothetical protein